jgi:hypothetical protein
MPKVGLQDAGVVAVIDKLKAAGAAERWQVE